MGSHWPASLRKRKWTFVRRTGTLLAMTKLNRAAWGVLGLAVLAVGQLGCGGDGGNSCGTFTPCGGNVVGRWNITQSCISAAEMMTAECPGQQVDSSGLKMSGSTTFNADMTYAGQVTISGSMSTTIPASCLMQDGITVTCEQLNAFFQLSLQEDPEAPFSAVSCSKAGSGCRCSFTFKATSSSEQGTYATAGNVLTLTSSDGDAESSDYCVSGNKLQVKPTMMAGMGEMDISGLVVFTKQ